VQVPNFLSLLSLCLVGAKLGRLPPVDANSSRRR
jgi:hypothetical protein